MLIGTELSQFTRIEHENIEPTNIKIIKLLNLLIDLFNHTEYFLYNHTYFTLFMKI
jgi:hypothetical protein